MFDVKCLIRLPDRAVKEIRSQFSEENPLSSSEEVDVVYPPQNLMYLGRFIGAVDGSYQQLLGKRFYYIFITVAD